jgi:phosphate-selective porin OprO/OprP
VEKGVLTEIEAQSLLEKEKQQKIEKGQLMTEWKDGLNFASHDGKHTLKIGGRIHADAAYFRQEKEAMDERLGQALDSTRFRRARIGFQGTVYDDFIYKLEFDWTDGTAGFRDVYMGYKNIPYAGTIKIGNFKEPFSLEELTSSNNVTFMERSLANIFAPSRKVGIALNNTLFDKRMTWAVGAFRDTDGVGRTTNNEHNFSARITGLPWYENKGEKLLHLGAGYRMNSLGHTTLRYRQRPEASMAQYFIDTGTINAHYANLIGLESALVYGPFSLQGELMQSFVNRKSTSSSLYFPGFYVQASYILTGENRRYSTSSGTFSNPKPKKNFSISEKTLGAWELAARYSYLDLTDKDVNGGVLNDITLGVNWYLNPNMRIMANYVHGHRSGLGDIDTIQMRFQTNF